MAGHDHDCHANDEEEERILLKKEDPFLQLGFGINSYSDTLKSLVFFFLTISVACIPVFYSYNSGKFGALRTNELNPFARMNVLTLGNLGGASVLCL